MFWWVFFLEDFSGGGGGGDSFYWIFVFHSFGGYTYTYAEQKQKKNFFGGGRAGGEPPRPKLQSVRYGIDMQPRAPSALDYHLKNAKNVRNFKASLGGEVAESKPSPTVGPSADGWSPWAADPI